MALGRLPYKVTQDPMVTPLRELAYLPKGVMAPHGLPKNSRRAGKLPQEIIDEPKKMGPGLKPSLHPAFGQNIGQVQLEILEGCLSATAAVGLGQDLDSICR